MLANSASARLTTASAHTDALSTRQRECIVRLNSTLHRWYNSTLRTMVREVSCFFPVLMFICLTGCASVPERRKEAGFAVTLPFMRMDGGECYYLDDFMPTPDNLVSGKSSGLFLRYYTFRSATYKTWEQERVMLAFYSRDNRCWSLFEEYSTGRF